MEGFEHGLDLGGFNARTGINHRKTDIGQGVIKGISDSPETK